MTDTPDLDDDNPVLHGDDGDTTWMAQGICSEIDPELFFPENGNTRDSRQARELCDGCPVIDACRRYAMERPSLEGIWGGTTFKERKKLRSQQADTGNKDAFYDEATVRRVVKMRETMTYTQIAEVLGWKPYRVNYLTSVIAPRYGLRVQKPLGSNGRTSPETLDRIRVMRLDGQTYREIGAELKMRPDTIKSICQRRGYIVRTVAA